MNPKECKEFLNGQIKIEVNSKYPMGQGYMPRVIQETHYSISLNGHVINLTESAFAELLRVLENNTKKEIIVELENKIFEQIHNQIDKEGLESLQNRYAEKFNKSVPPRYRNNMEWIEGALAE